MNSRNDASLPQPPAQNLVFHPSSVAQGALVSVTSGMHMWSQSAPQVTDSSGRLIQLPRQAIIMTNMAGAANNPIGGTNTTANSAFIRSPVSSIATASPGPTPLVFAASTPDGTALVRAPMPTQLVTSQLAPSASAPPPLTSLVLSTPSSTPSSTAVVVSNVGTPAAPAAAPTTSSPTQPAPVALASSQSASAVLDQSQPPPSSPMPKVVSFQSVAVESPGSQSVAPTPPSQDTSVTEVAPPAPTQSVYANSDGSQSMVFTAKSLSDLVKETDPDMQLDDETEEALMQLSEEFVESVAEKAIRLAIHRGSAVVEAKDVKFSLDRDWNIFVPGFPSAEKTWKRPFVLAAHKQRLAIAKKQLKRT